MGYTCESCIPIHCYTRSSTYATMLMQINGTSRCAGKKARTVQVLDVTLTSPGNKPKTNLGASSKGSLIKKMQKLKAGKGR